MRKENDMSEHKTWLQRHGGAVVAFAILGVLVALMVLNAN